MLALLLLASLAFVACVSAGSGPPVGLQGGTLRACPEKPNCVCSEGSGVAASTESAIEPFAVPPGTDPDAAFEALLGVLGEVGRDLRREGDWAHAVFVTSLMRFRDDVEVRLDRGSDGGEARIHVRSASRLGYSDLGANRRRVEDLRERLSAALGASSGE